MPRNEVDILAELLDSAFQRAIPDDWSDGWHSLLSNLCSVRDEDWNWLPPDGKRPISRLAAHCGAAMRVYADYGFGAGKLQWTEVIPPRDTMSTKAALIPWLVESHATLSSALASCSDDQLDDLRETWDRGRHEAASLVRHHDDRPHPLPRRRNQPHPCPRPEERRLARDALCFTHDACRRRPAPVQPRSCFRRPARERP